MPDGSLEPVRCGASNRCDYCAMFAALEAALVLKLDAQIRQPTVGLTTTTARPDHPLEELREAERFLWRSLRKGMRIGRGGARRRAGEFEAFPDLQYVGFVEWTTGKGTHSGGHRRPHIHHLVKGIPAGHELLEEILVEDERGEPVKTTRLEQRVSELWRAYTGDAYVVDARELRTPAGAISYLALHHHKKRQAPPAGFTGRRLRPSKGYYEQPIAQLRELARRLAAHDRVLIACKRAIGIELYGDEPPEEWEADAALTAALVGALRNMAADPLPLQLRLGGSLDDPEHRQAERRELVARTVRMLEQIRQEKPPELVRVHERRELDEETGEVTYRATAILGRVAA